MLKSMFILAVILSGIVIACAVVPLRVKRKWKILLSCLVFAVALKFLIIRFFGGPAYFAPQVSDWFLLTASWFHSVLMIFCLLSVMMIVIRSAARLIFLICRRKLPQHWIHWINRINAGLLAGSVILASAGIYRALQCPAVRTEIAVFPNLPETANSMKIVFLTDLHAGKIIHHERIQEIVNRVNVLNPDVILLGGDYVDGSFEECQNDLLPLKELKAKYGVYGVPGNHEYYSGYEEWIGYLKKLGIHFLLNDSVRLPNGVVIAGTTDPASLRRPGLVKPDLKKALKNISEHDFIISVAHQPKETEKAAELGVSLQLSGHTHGGMVPLLSSMVASANGGYVSGWYQVKHMKLYVSNGSGIWNGFPMRLKGASEITLLQLQQHGKDL